MENIINPRKTIRFLTLLIAFITISTPLAAYSPEVSFQSGAVFSRGLVLGDLGKQVYVEYDQSGQEVDVIGEEQPDWEGARIISGSQYRRYLEAYDNLMLQKPDAVLYGRDSFEASVILTVNNQPVDRSSILLAENTLAVVILPQDEIFLPDTEIVLLELPINPQIRPSGSAKSIFMKDDGTIIRESENNIGVRVSYLVDSAGEPVEGTYRKPTDEIVSPIAGATIEMITPFPLGQYVGTDSEGKYVASYMKICPGFTMDIVVGLFLELRYTRFNPQGSDHFPYYLHKTSYDYCSGLSALFASSPSLTGQMTGIALIGIESTIARPVYNVDFPVDIITLSGTAYIRNPGNAGVSVSETENTQYNDAKQNFEKQVQDNYDFDGDSRSDKALLGKIVTEQDANGNDIEVFHPTSPDQAEIQGVWLSGKHNLATLDIAKVLPDLRRVPDWSEDHANRGLLSRINIDDLQNTDIYLFRESDGVLITEQNGLSGENIFLQAGEGVFHYTLPIVGANERFYTGTSGGGPLRPGGADAFKQWQIASQMNEQFYQREADHLRQGEPVRVIAINRATGYIGSLTTDVKSEGAGNFLSFPFEDIVMYPPNLRIWAERRADIEAGLRKGEELKFVIGNEGAALADDKLVVIYSEWLDADGYPFPEELGKAAGRDYGYTGRIARVSNGALQPDSSLNAGDGQAQFPIAPGRQTQLVRLPQGVLGEQHYHINVSGEPYIRNPDFSSSGAQSGILSSRPDRYVPFKVKVFDEESTLEAQQVWTQTSEWPGNENLEKPDPVYKWFYRPDYQFSVYDLNVDEIIAGKGNGEEVEVYLQDPYIISSDEFVKILYSLVAPADAPLPAYSYQGDRELILSIGGEEALVTIGADRTIRFDRLDHLSSVGSEDLLAIQLYSNNDAANILWEWAFYGFEVAVDLNRNGKLEFSRQYYSEDKELTGSAPLDSGNTPTDLTAPWRPFSFWINNDWDIVSNDGTIEPDLVECPEGTGGDGQVCEQWDATPTVTANNTGNDHLARIETYRDLEDFFPLAINTAGLKSGPEETYTIELKASGIAMNLFRGAWKDTLPEHKAHTYLFEDSETRNQVEVANRNDGYFMLIDASTNFRQEIDEFKEQWEDKDGIIKFIAEAVSTNPNCRSQPDTCYLNVALYRTGSGSGEEKVQERKIYFNFLNIEQFYQTVTAGTAQVGTPALGGCFNWINNAGFVAAEPHAISLESGVTDWIHRNVSKQSFRESHKIVHVHGWRMLDAEKKTFADTAFKRLYWSGYQGQFAAVNWPTGWFDKPSHCYATAALLADGHAQNYDESEVVARLSGVRLAEWLQLQRQANPSTEFHIIAHSMGNVVVSEALRHASGTLVDSYSASQAAEVGGSYDSAIQDMLHQVAGPPGLNDPKESWEWYNTQVNEHSTYAMPPDIYRFTNFITNDNGNYDIRHRETENETVMRAQLTGPAIPYYRSSVGNIYSSADRILNYFNVNDAALDAWEINQLTKPDTTPGNRPDWAYGNNRICEFFNDPITGDALGYFYPDGTECDTPTTDVSSYYYRERVKIDWNPELPIDGSEEQINYARIMAFITPARTEALGQLAVVPSGMISNTNFNFNTFAGSNQGHSSQFHAYLAQDDSERKRYWDTILSDSVMLDAETDYSGLHIP